jgi:valyl-tRNA synthetase
MDKTYRPDEVETRRYAEWESAGAFGCGDTRGEASNRAPYTIVIPPPNVTGSLHMGHALNNTLQDILIRYARMRGRDALWQPGTDHAGIATQMVVERQLADEGKSRNDLGREKFIERVWKWKAESGGTITRQLRRLGASCDWSRERFTMDDGLSAAVRKVFVTLYKQGLIYRDQRLVNWDPKLGTAISDLEVEQREVKGRLWHFKYPIEGAPGEFITVATTRPETMLGDTAVAVHPDDERYRALVGKRAILPLVGRRIPIVADRYSDPEKGTGAVKITPAHDFNDFEVGRRHKLPMVSIFDGEARLNDQAPERLRGLPREEARKRVLAELEALGLVAKVEDNPMTLPYGDRSGVVIEPRLTDQWYVDAKTLAQPAIKAVEDGRIRFVPKHWENTYFEWMRNIQPWCVSRQIWWGHQIPAWYGPDGRVFVEPTEAEAATAAAAHYKRKVALTRDPDVLDTWFSSALWPFSTLGWPADTAALRRHYPTDVLVTGFDIIFFWVARMAMMGMHFMGEVPFRTVYVHALVRDEKGQKMSKSKGNVLDPLDLIDKYGADALRFTLTALAAQGRDIKLSAGRIEGYRNFVTKIWNAARYAEMNGCRPVAGFDPAACALAVDRWIVGEMASAAASAAEALEDFRFNDAAHALYQFTWHSFCDWYIEFTKPVLTGGDEDAKAEVRATTAWVLERLVHLLHPVMPFVTEELWHAIAPEGQERAGLLMLEPWPDFSGIRQDTAAATEMNWIIRLIGEIRAIRAEMNVPPGAKLSLHYRDATPEARARLTRHRDLVERIGRLGSIAAMGADLPRGAAQFVVDGVSFALPLGEVIDLDKERKRLANEIRNADQEIARIDGKLANHNFVARAPAEVVEEQRERRAEYALSRGKLAAALERLGSG